MQIVHTILVAIACTLFAAAPVEAQSKRAKTGKVAATKTQKTQAKKVDINRASAEELVKALDGVGKKRAAAIVAHRKKGSFKTTDDLLKVPGIGPAIVAKNLSRLGLPRGTRSLDVKGKAGKARAGKLSGKKPVGKSSTKKAATKKATSKKPATKKGTSKKPATKKGSSKKPSTKKGSSKSKTRK